MHQPLGLFLIALLSLAPSVAAGAAPQTAMPVGDLKARFATPPDSARPWVYWFWKNGNINREAITADLEAMQRVGIGGVILMEVALTTPKGPIEFFSPAWRELFKHAVAEADRLGLEICVNSAPGWTGSGGPWIPPEHSMQKVVASRTQVSGPRRFEEVLPQPETLCGFYQDIAVLAYPTPQGDYRIADVAEKALYKRGPFSSMPGVRPAFAPVAEYSNVPSEQCIALDGIVDLTGKMDAAGHLVWEVPAGAWTIVRFGRTSTGQTNRPAPSPGLECDKLDPEALDEHFRQFTAQLLSDAGAQAKKTLVATHMDSWEVGGQNWTGRMREEFRNRRGYDPLRYLPVMTGCVAESLEVSERFLWDLRQTVSELIVENHGRHMRELARQHGLWLSIEPYDMTPCDDMSLGATADVPMCEFWTNTFDTRYSVKEATSIGHVYGKPIIAAEAFTSTESWLFHPAGMKPLGDWAFCEGVNRFVIHRYVHQPFLQIRPGISLGPHGIHYERTQTWWELTRPWHQYLARCQYLLRQGSPVADILYLSPEGAPNVFQSPKPAPEGYKFDACTPEALLTRVSVRDGRLVLPDAMSYRLLVLSQSATMTPTLLCKVRQLLEEGATVVGSPPRKSPSLSDYPQCDREVQQLADVLWGAKEVPATLVERSVGKGRLVWGGEIGRSQQSEPEHRTVYPSSETIVTLLTRKGISPDFAADKPLGYAHRQIGERDSYFVSNGSDATVEASCTFRVAGKRPELWHPETGQIRPLPQYSTNDAIHTTVPLRFEPNESYFIVFLPSPARGRGAGGEGGEPSNSVLPQQANFPLFKPVLTITGPWAVEFDRAFGGPKDAVIFQELTDWTKRPEEAIKYYSGTATYRKTLDISPDMLGQDRRLCLNLGRVAVMARVTLNGKDLGVAWKAPFRIDMTSAVQPGENRLEVQVVNLWPNRMIGDEHLPLDCELGPDGKTVKSWPQWLLDGKPSPTGRYTFATWREWTKDSPLLESGLLGPVTLEVEQPASAP
jgi:hypothetical protein